MTWVLSGVVFLVVWIVAGLAVGRLFFRMAAPATEEERRAEDEAQIEWLHRGGKNSPAPPPEPPASSSAILTSSRVHVSSAAVGAEGGRSEAPDPARTEIQRLV